VDDQRDVRIFISYRRDDAAGDAGRLNDALGDYFGSEQVFLDVDDILLGDKFGGDIKKAIEHSAAVMVVIGPRWLDASDARGRRLEQDDDYVRTEIHHAIAYRKPIFPVCVHGARMPGPNELPGDIAGLAGFNGLTLSDANWRADVTSLVNALERSGVPVPPVTAFPEEPPSGKAEQRLAWLVSGDEETVRKRIETFATAHGMLSSGTFGDTQQLRGGRRLSSRLLGGFFVSEQKLPTTAKIRLGNRGTKVAVEALVREDWGMGVFQGGMKQRYESWFQTWMRDLHQATGA
jgi:hypothetical protein